MYENMHRLFTPWLFCFHIICIEFRYDLPIFQTGTSRSLNLKMASRSQVRAWHRLVERVLRLNVNRIKPLENCSDILELITFMLYIYVLQVCKSPVYLLRAKNKPNWWIALKYHSTEPATQIWKAAAMLKWSRLCWNCGCTIYPIRWFRIV